MTTTPSKNRISITNLSGLVSRIYKAIFPTSQKSSLSSTDTFVIKDSDGNPYYITASQMTTISGVQLESYTSDDLPDADPAGQMIYISDEGVVAYSNGTDWIS